MDVASITRIVEESFRDTARPHDVDHALFAVNDGSIPEFMQMIRCLDWMDFLYVLEHSQFAKAQLYGGMFGYMTSEAVHYFAPALLIFSMNEQADVLPQVIYGKLYPFSGYYESNQEAWQLLYSLLTDQQKQAIALVVDHYFAVHSVLTEYDMSVREYWRHWLPKVIPPMHD